MKETDSLFIKKLPHFYSFAFVLIPDDLQATQLVVDSISQYLIVNRENLAKNKNNQEKLEECILQNIFELALKRFSQIKLSLNFTTDHRENFYRLETEERAALFLREVKKMNYEEIMWILNKTTGELKAILASARYKIFEIPESRELIVDG